MKAAVRRKNGRVGARKVPDPNSVPHPGSNPGSNPGWAFSSICFRNSTYPAPLLNPSCRATSICAAENRRGEKRVLRALALGEKRKRLAGDQALEVLGRLMRREGGIVGKQLVEQELRGILFAA